MTLILRLAAVLFLLAGGLPASAAPLLVPPKPGAGSILVVPAAALTFEFGVSEGLILRTLSRRGFTDIKVTYRGMTKGRAEACKDGKRYTIEVTPGGKIRNSAEIGRCRGALPIQRAERMLAKRGYRQIRIHPAGGGFVALACRQNQRFRISMNQFGDVRHEQQLGRCGGGLNAQQIAAQLRYQGYSRITVTPERPGRFSAEACNGDRRVSLRLDRDGQIARERQIGRCDPPIHPAHIPARLAAQGLTRIEVTDTRLPRYMARACRDERRLEISLNRFGEIVEERPIGHCRPPLTAENIIDTLRSMGYGSVRIVQQHPNGFVAEACHAANKVELTLTLYGETLNQRHLGHCPSPPVGDVLAEFEGRGLGEARMFIEGCRRGQRVRIELDRYGDPVDTRLAGRCR